MVRQWQNLFYENRLSGVDLEGNPTALLDVVKAADVARLTQEDWDRERNKMLETCNSCHSGNFAKLLESCDTPIKLFPITSTTFFASICSIIILSNPHTITI